MYSRSNPRRRHGPEFKAKVLADCDEPGASISGVALAHGLNANPVRQWRAGRGVKRAGVTVVTAAAAGTAIPSVKVAVAPPPTSLPVGTRAEFVAIKLPAPRKTTSDAASGPIEPAPAPSSTPDPHIHVKLRRGPLQLDVRWPTAAAADCKAWLSELTSGVVSK